MSSLYTHSQNNFNFSIYQNLSIYGVKGHEIFNYKDFNLNSKFILSTQPKGTLIQFTMFDSFIINYLNIFSPCKYILYLKNIAKR